MYNPDDVRRLAQELRVDIRPQHITRQDAGAQLVRYIQERQQYDEEMLRSQQQINERLGSIDAMNERLERIEAQMSQPVQQRGPSWTLVAMLVLVLVLNDRTASQDSALPRVKSLSDAVCMTFSG